MVVQYKKYSHDHKEINLKNSVFNIYDFVMNRTDMSLHQAASVVHTQVYAAVLARSHQAPPLQKSILKHYIKACR